MKEKVLKYWLYLLINFISFLGFSIFTNNTVGGTFILMFFLSFIVMATSLLSGYNNKQFCFIYCLLTGVLFIPMALIFLNKNSIYCAIVFLVLALIFNYSGYKIWEKEERKRIKKETAKLNRKKTKKKKKQ